MSQPQSSPQFAFKVVSCWLTSARACWNSLQYEIGTWTLPTIPHSKIMVFDTYSAARHFRECNERIFVCEVINAEPRKTLVQSLSVSIEDFWSGKYTPMAADYNVPAGTLGCDACKLLVEVT